MEIFKLIICYAIMAVVPYFVCGINPAIIVTKIKSGEDIRKLGSGNAGLTNTLRTQGKTAAFFVLLGDVGKGIISILAVRFSFYYIAGINCGENYMWVLYAAGISAILGHVFPVYFGFKGGKGVLVTVAVLLAVDWLPALILLGIFGVIVAVSRYVSLGSVIAATLYPFTVLVFGIIENDPCFIANFCLSAVIASLIIFMHRENIKRLRNKTEKKLGQKAEIGEKKNG